MRSKFRTLLNESSGFTLLEVLIAMAIMAVALGAIIAVEGGSINAASRAKQMNIVGMLAKNKMVEMEYLIEGKKFGEVRKEDQGNFEPPYQDYHWKTEVKEIEFPNITAKLPAGGSGSGNSQGSSSGNDQGNPINDMITKGMTDFLSKAIREVRVNISWNRGGKTQEFSLSTYWVNLNYEFKITQ